MFVKVTQREELWIHWRERKKGKKDKLERKNITLARTKGYIGPNKDGERIIVTVKKCLNKIK